MKFVILVLILYLTGCSQLAYELLKELGMPFKNSKKDNN